MKPWVLSTVLQKEMGRKEKRERKRGEKVRKKRVWSKNKRERKRGKRNRSGDTV